MLRLITGKEKSGKTAAMMTEIRDLADRGTGNLFLIVPEQFSHEAERELCTLCGDSMSLHAEVLSFSGLGRKLASMTGGASARYLDEGGKLLCMALTMSELSPALEVFASSAHRSEVQRLMMDCVDELKLADISPEKLNALAGEDGSALGKKFREIALIYDGFCRRIADGAADPADAMAVLAEHVAASTIDEGWRFYIDGFSDFTAAERNVVRELLKKGARVTVSLTLDDIDGGAGLYSVSRFTARTLLQSCAELGVKTEIVPMEPTGAADCEVILRRAGSVIEECQLAADRVTELADGGCRFRDIAIAIRGFEDYRPSLEAIFSARGLPLFTARKSAILSKPLALLLRLAYDITLTGWNPDDVLSYLGTSLTGLSPEEADALSDYVFRWQPRESLWKKPGDWKQHPDGFDKETDETVQERLGEINRCRRIVAAPLLRFGEANRVAGTVGEYARALAQLMEDLKLAETMTERADYLRGVGESALADELLQLWNVCVEALEQMDAICTTMKMETEDFASLFLLVLSGYDVGVIPVSMDAVTAGDFDRMRKRNLKHLIVLGAGDERLPAAAADSGILSDDEREFLGIGCGRDNELWREFALISDCLSLPSESLTVATSTSESYVIRELKKAGYEIGDYVPAADGEFRVQRGRLTESGVRALYPGRMAISASKADEFYQCKYAYFCKYGLKAKPTKKAEFDASEVGTFIHTILERVAREVSEKGGFSAVTDEEILALTDAAMADYEAGELRSFEEKSERFIFLFRRIEDRARRILLDTARELRSSKFVPVDFELDFRDRGRFPPIALNSGADELTLSGIADRVDVWENEGKKYLRIADYKTGEKEFSLTDIWYGKSLQMLMYLYALDLSEDDIVPAGIMYVPAKSKVLSFTGAPGEAELNKKRTDETRRSGILLDGDGVPEAWEVGSDSLKPKKRMNAQQYTLLTEHMKKKLGEMAAAVRSGSIEADPGRQGSTKIACDYCDFAGTCGFRDGENGEHERQLESFKDEEIWEMMAKEDGTDE